MAVMDDGRIIETYPGMPMPAASGGIVEAPLPGYPTPVNTAPVISTAPVVRGQGYPQRLPEIMNYGNIPAYQQSGPYYSPAGARAGYEDYGFPPPIFQSSPYATANGRVFTGPNGQLGWQALQGFPSRYPHVLNGVPNDFWSIISPYMPALWPQATWRPPAQTAAPAAPRRASGGGAPKQAAPKQAAPAPAAPAPAPAPTPGIVNYGEMNARANIIPKEELAPPPPQEINYPWMYEFSPNAPQAAYPAPMVPGNNSTPATDWADNYLDENAPIRQAQRIMEARAAVASATPAPTPTPPALAPYMPASPLANRAQSAAQAYTSQVQVPAALQRR